MAFWKQKYNQTEGFSLIEVMVSIAILGFVAVPMFTGLLFSYRLNQRSDEKLQAQLAVSNAVETIMAEGYKSADNDYETRFPSVSLTAEAVINSDPDNPLTIYYELTASCGDIIINTCVRPYVAPPGGGS